MRHFFIEAQDLTQQAGACCCVEMSGFKAFNGRPDADGSWHEHPDYHAFQVSRGPYRNCLVFDQDSPVWCAAALLDAHVPAWPKGRTSATTTPTTTGSLLPATPPTTKARPSATTTPTTTPYRSYSRFCFGATGSPSATTTPTTTGPPSARSVRSTVLQPKPATPRKLLGSPDRVEESTGPTPAFDPLPGRFTRRKRTFDDMVDMSGPLFDEGVAAAVQKRMESSFNDNPDMEFLNTSGISMARRRQLRNIMVNGQPRGPPAACRQ